MEAWLSECATSARLPRLFAYFAYLAVNLHPFFVQAYKRVSGGMKLGHFWRFEIPM